MPSRRRPAHAGALPGPKGPFPDTYRRLALDLPPVLAYGRVTRIAGLTLESLGPRCRVGDAAQVAADGEPLTAEVVGFRDGRVLLMPLGELRAVAAGAIVTTDARPFRVPVGPALLGRVLDGLGRPVDGGPPVWAEERWEVERRPPPPLERRPIDRPLATGVRAIDALVTIGRGQRVGVFAGSGVGKSTLLGMLARTADVDAAVVCLVGERGREVRDFLEGPLGSAGLARSVVVVSTSDEPARVRIRAAQTATTLAEYFRARGMDVLFIMDSITRYAMARREVGLAVGEPPTARGYTPSVFAELPRLLERTGTDRHGSITAVYTVLVDGDDLTEPVTDAVRSILDGHVVLSRVLAEAGHFPAIDPAASVSRLMPRVAGPEHLHWAAEAKARWSAYENAADLIRVGAYVAGRDRDIDRAVASRPHLARFLQQDMEEVSPWADTLAGLAAALAAGEA